MKNLRFLLVLVTGTLGLGAQDWQYSAKLGLVSAQGDLATLTQRHNGFMGELSAQNRFVEGLDYRFHVGHLVVRRENYTGLAANDPRNNTADAKNTWIGAEFVYLAYAGKVDFYTGPTLNQWDVVTKGQGSQGDTNWHMGWRAGITWNVTKNWGVDVHYGLSEWQRYQSSVPGAARLQINPSWLGMSARYSF